MKTEKLSSTQSEVIIWAMFGIENEVDFLKKMLLETTEAEEIFIRNQIKKREEHYKALQALIEG